jgi:nicotinate phosphoribosyltransferase
MKTALATDLYQLTMMAGYHDAGITGRSTFELFVRTLPAQRGYLVAAGIEQALDYLSTLRFTDDEIAFLRGVPALSPAPHTFFDEVLPSFRFTGDVWSVAEGEPVFASEPILRVSAPASEAQLVETALLSIVNFQTLIASKAARLVDAARGRAIVEFGARRAHGLEAALYAARAAFVGGAVATSDVEAGYRFGIPLSGTMAHSWVMTFSSEEESFRAYLDTFGNDTTLLLDTYDTLDAARLVIDAGLRPAAVRLDSGDLAALSRGVRDILDAGGLTKTRILASGDLDEDVIASLVAAGAPIDAFGVGTSLSTSQDAPALGGIYKLVEVERGGVTTPVLKLSEGKRTLPGAKQVWRRDTDGAAVADVIGLASEPATGRPLLAQSMVAGSLVRPHPALGDVQRYSRARVESLPAGVRRLHDWDTYPVTTSAALDALADSLARRGRRERKQESDNRVGRS